MVNGCAVLMRAHEKLAPTILRNGPSSWLLHAVPGAQAKFLLLMPMLTYLANMLRHAFEVARN